MDVQATTSSKDRSFWRSRLALPLYQVKDAARLAGVTTQTVLNWEKHSGRSAISKRADRASLSYLQLVELRFVAAMREAGLKLIDIKRAREYMEKKFGEYPFARQRFKHNGQDVIIEMQELVGQAGVGKALIANKNGQLAWKDIIGERFTEFDYSPDLAVRWHPVREHRQIVVDPEVAFGAPSVHGTPIWALHARHAGGESIAEIAEDFQLSTEDVSAALDFAGALANVSARAWTH